MEHAAQLKHVKLADQLAHASDATCVAITSGMWTDPDTWIGGSIPEVDARVHIPSHAAVTFDAESDVILKTLRVDGILSWSTTRSTEMSVETIVTTPGAKFEIGTPEHPMDDQAEAVIIFRDTPIDVTTDDDQLSHGLIAFGQINIQGAMKESHLAITDPVTAGCGAVMVKGDLANWSTGDKVLVLSNTDDAEERTITRIHKKEITLDFPLRKDIAAPAFIANLTRNVTLRSEDPEGLRGHVMLHNGVAEGFVTANNIRYAAFEGLGRTDCSVQTGTMTNPVGRHPVHLNEIGTGPDVAVSMIAANVINGSPGWGIAHNNSQAIVTQNIVYDACGAGIFAATGFETGVWVANLLIDIEPGAVIDIGHAHPVFGARGVTMTSQLLPEAKTPQLDRLTTRDALPPSSEAPQDNIAQSDEIIDFAIEEGDTLDLSEVAQSFGLDEEGMKAALRLTDLARGLQISLMIDDELHNMVVIRGIDARTFVQARAWSFEDMSPPVQQEPEAQTAPPAIETPVSEPVSQPKLVAEHAETPTHFNASDDFVFDALQQQAPAMTMYSTPISSSDRIKLSDIAEAYGVDEAQMTRAIKMTETENAPTPAPQEPDQTKTLSFKHQRDRSKFKPADAMTT